jgi:predicted nuclease with TOPRIM domain
MKIENESLTSKVEQLEATIAKKSESAAEAQTKLESLQKEISDLHEDRDNFEEAFEKLLEEKESYTSKFSQLVEEYENLEQKYDQESVENQRLSEENKSLKISVENITNKFLEERNMMEQKNDQK